MKYLHTMLRISDIDSSIKFYCGAFGLQEIRRVEVKEGKFTLIFLAAAGDESSQIELTYNWDGDDLGEGSRNYGHLAYHVDDIYEACSRLKDIGVTINRPPRDGRMAFIKSPDGISIEILQEGNSLPIEEHWKSMENVGNW